MKWDDFKQLSAEKKEEWQFKFGNRKPLITGNDVLTFFFIKYSLVSFLFMLAMLAYFSQGDILKLEPETMVALEKLVLFFSDKIPLVLWSIIGIVALGTLVELWYFGTKWWWERKEKKTIKQEVIEYGR